MHASKWLVISATLLSYEQAHNLQVGRQDKITALLHQKALNVLLW